MLDYGQIIDLDNVTIQDCENLYDNVGKVAIIEDGRVINFMKEEDEIESN